MKAKKNFVSCFSLFLFLLFLLFFFVFSVPVPFFLFFFLFFSFSFNKRTVNSSHFFLFLTLSSFFLASFFFLIFFKVDNGDKTNTWWFKFLYCHFNSKGEKNKIRKKKIHWFTVSETLFFDKTKRTKVFCFPILLSHFVRLLFLSCSSIKKTSDCFFKFRTFQYFLDCFCNFIFILGF